ncbi:MAG TPA: patatin-like phospholipase family protein [Leptospiraceae bacterium]|nr:patatin-like phospholipase family protein [Leptospiraceae bacterium]HMW08323.1 patatin-like phospholipase family protein [Leptospiraceae bacterium]HMX35471.1 patatin-like phospholipase family protein [Leptospiraceae bacterium]HMY34430.1 patatin-like phospholipase family protein [Leptospiraceae bacterium]HMZ66892.1 patatin-like phospholipase family protein [Leptospiraceae bacterium]
MSLPKNKTKSSRALIVEGGGMRGAFAGGVLSAMCKYYPVDNYDLVVGVSAGSCSLAYYTVEETNELISKQTILDIWKHELNGSKFISLLNYFKGKKPLDHKYLIDYLLAQKYRLKSENLHKNDTVPFYVVVSNLHTLLPEYVRASKDNVLQLLRAATSLPIATRGKEWLDQKLYSDGGVMDPIPIKAVIAAGYKDITVVLNKSRDHLSEPVGKLVSFLSFPTLPKVAEFLREKHHLMYNEAKHIINNPPKGIKIKILDPKENIDVGLTTTNKKSLIETVNHGWEVAYRMFNTTRQRTKSFRRKIDM